MSKIVDIVIDESKFLKLSDLTYAGKESFKEFYAF